MGNGWNSGSQILVSSAVQTLVGLREIFFGRGGPVSDVSRGAVRLKFFFSQKHKNGRSRPMGGNIAKVRALV